MRLSLVALTITALFHFSVPAGAQDSFSSLPGHDKYKSMSAASRLGSDGRARNIRWAEDGASLSFQQADKHFKVNLSDFGIEPTDRPQRPSSSATASPRSGRRPRVGRAQQATEVRSPDGQWIAFYRNFNVVLERAPQPAEENGDGNPVGESQNGKGNGSASAAKEEIEPVQVTKAGTEFFRYGTGCWVYGEELNQRTAMWWSPDSRKLAFYEMDERHMQDYYLTTNNTGVYTQLQTVRYPKPGEANPYAGLLIYDLETHETTRVEVGGDRRQYVFNIRFTPDGSELLFNRTNRRQNILEIAAADPKTGQSRVVVKETQDTWQKNRPLMQFLADGKRFIWETERTGWEHYELRHLDGRLLNPLSAVEPYPTASILRVDEKAGLFYYTAYSGKQPLNVHLHRVQLDGAKHMRLTNRPRNHTSLNVSPDDKWFVAVYEAVGVPPTTGLFNLKGEQVAVLAKADSKKAEELGLVAQELFTFKADDGKTDLQGTLYKPANFDPNKTYPLVVSVYGGPSSRGISNRYSAANAYCEFGFLVATIANRGTTGRGKAFESASYQNLGIVDIKDQADGVRFLCQRPYVDATRVGIYGHSYGGYMSALALVKFPDVFAVGVAGAPVTDWKNYDTTYTERYMRTPQENPNGYRDGSCMTYAKDLKGKLLLMHGLIDDNVHPSNTWQLVSAFQQANVRFEMMIYPTSKHGFNSTSLRWEYLHRHLRPEPLTTTEAKSE